MGYIGDVYVYTQNGLVKSSRVYPPYRKMPSNSSSSHSVGLAVGGKKVQATKFHYGGSKKVLKVTTAGGFFISGTYEHQVMVHHNKGVVWRRLDALKVRDKIAIPVGTNLWGKQPYSSQRQSMPGWTLEAFRMYLRRVFKNSLSRYGPGIRLRAGSRDGAHIMQLQFANMGYMCSVVSSRSRCCQKHYVGLLGEDSKVVSQYIRKGDVRILGTKKFRYRSDVVEYISKAQENVFCFGIPKEEMFAAGGFMNHGV